MGLVTSSRGGSETRPAGHVAGLPGAGCPGSGSVVRYHEARDRTEPKALKASGKSRGRAPRGERAFQKEARAARTRKARRASACRAGPAESTPRLSALRLPFVCWEALFLPCNKARAQKNRAARTGLLCFTSSRTRGTPSTTPATFWPRAARLIIAA